MQSVLVLFKSTHFVFNTVVCGCFACLAVFVLLVLHTQLWRCFKVLLWLNTLVLFRLLHIIQKVRVTQALCQSSPQLQTDPAAPANPLLRANNIPPASVWPGVSWALSHRLWTCITIQCNYTGCLHPLFPQIPPKRLVAQMWPSMWWSCLKDWVVI